MAKHDGKFKVPERPLGRAAVFQVKRDGEPLGRLKVSNRTIVWIMGIAPLGLPNELDGL